MILFSLCLCGSIAMESARLGYQNILTDGNVVSLNLDVLCLRMFSMSLYVVGNGFIRFFFKN